MTDAARMTEETEAQAEPQAETAEAPATDELAAAREEIAKLKDMYLRAMAETENVRTRLRREVEDTAKFASTKFARDMVNIVENLSRATASVSPEARASNEVLKQVGDGLDMTLQELLGVFERNGIRRVSPLGEKFDHNMHEAVAQVDAEGIAPGCVAQVLQAGYMLHDRLLRPAMVTVARQQPVTDTTA